MTTARTSRTVLVTGAGSGIGRAIAERFAADGASLGLLDVEEASIESLGASLGERHGDACCELLPADVRDGKGVERAVARLVDTFGGLDVLVNGAAVGHFGPLLELNDTEWRETVDVILTGAFNTLRHAAPAIAASGGGCIVQLGSVSSLVGTPGMTAYCAAKGGVLLLARAAALELAPLGIRVAVLCPGSVETPLLRRFLAAAGEEAVEHRRREDVAAHPLGRYGTPAEMANAAFFLASDAASYITGSALVVDGGFTAI